MPGTEKRVCLELRGAKKSFRSGEITVEVLHGIDLRIYDGELTIILGQSGSGKTTLLNLMGALDQPTEGKVLFRGRDLGALSNDELSDFRRRHLGFVFQLYNLVPTLTAGENVEVATEEVDGSMTAGEALALVGLEDREQSFPAQLSGGEQQRVAIARAVARRPELLLCDELTGALDSATGRKVLDLVVDLNHRLGMTIVVITHAVPIADLAHRVVRIDSGMIVDEHKNDRRRTVAEIDW